MIEKIPKWSVVIKDETQIEFYVNIIHRYGMIFSLCFITWLTFLFGQDKGWGIGVIIVSILLVSLLFFFVYIAIRNKPTLIINEQGVWTKYSDLIYWNDFETDSITYDGETGTQIAINKNGEKQIVNLWIGVTDIRLKQITETYRQRGAAEAVRLLRTL